MRTHSCGTKLIYVPLGKRFQVENASFRPPLYISPCFIATEECLATESLSGIFLAAQKRRLTHIDWSPNDIAVTSRLNSNTVSELGSNPRISPDSSFLPIPFHLFPAQGSYLSKVRRSLKGLLSCASSPLSPAFGPREFRNHFRRQPAFSLSLSFSRLMHSARVCETPPRIYEDDTSQGFSLNRKHTS